MLILQEDVSTLQNQLVWIGAVCKVHLTGGHGA